MDYSKRDDRMNTTQKIRKFVSEKVENFVGEGEMMDKHFLVYPQLRKTVFLTVANCRIFV